MDLVTSQESAASSYLVSDLHLDWVNSSNKMLWMSGSRKGMLHLYQNKMDEISQDGGGASTSRTDPPITLLTDSSYLGSNF